MSDSNIDYVDTREAVRLLRIRPRALYEMIDSGQLPAYKRDRTIVVRRSDLKDWLERNRGDDEE